MAVDFSQSKLRYFQLLLDTDNGKADDDDDLTELYFPMQYDALFLYSDKTQPHFSRFQLPWYPFPSPDSK